MYVWISKSSLTDFNVPAMYIRCQNKIWSIKIPDSISGTIVPAGFRHNRCKIQTVDVAADWFAYICCFNTLYTSLYLYEPYPEVPAEEVADKKSIYHIAVSRFTSIYIYAEIFVVNEITFLKCSWRKLLICIIITYRVCSVAI